MPTFAIITLLVGLVLISCLSVLCTQQAAGSRGLSRCALFGYVVTMLYVTIFSRMPVLEVRLQLIPFFEFNRIKGIGFVENMILFVPAGALLLLSFPLRARWGYAFGFLLSLGVEILQFFSHRGIADIDDLIANTLGAMLGTCFCIAMQRLIRSFCSDEDV